MDNKDSNINDYDKRIEINEDNSNWLYWNWTYKQYYIAMIIDFLFVGLLIILVLSISKKAPKIDLIENTKNIFIYSQLVAILVSAIFPVVFNFLVKSKDKLINILKIIIIMSLFALIIFLLIKINMDITYKKNKFIQLYQEETYMSDIEKNSNLQLSISEKGIKLVEMQEKVIEDNVKSYSYFKFITLLETVIYVIVIAFDTVLMIKIDNKNNKENQVKSSFDILFDDEQNVKY